jgi:hypothetical protein
MWEFEASLGYTVRPCQKKKKQKQKQKDSFGYICIMLNFMFTNMFITVAFGSVNLSFGYLSLIAIKLI